jgi:hypothetical protein
MKLLFKTFNVQVQWSLRTSQHASEQQEIRHLEDKGTKIDEYLKKSQHFF